MAIWYSNNQVFIGCEEKSGENIIERIIGSVSMSSFCGRCSFAHGNEACFKNNSRHETRFRCKLSTFCRRHRRVNRFSPSRCRCLLILFTASIHKKKRRRQEKISSCVKRYYFNSIFMRAACLHGHRVVRVLCVCLSTSHITLLWIDFRFWARKSCKLPIDWTIFRILFNFRAWI